MKTEDQVRDMLTLFDNTQELDVDGEAVQLALEWVLGYHHDSYMTEYLPTEQ